MQPANASLAVRGLILTACAALAPPAPAAQFVGGAVRELNIPGHESFRGDSYSFGQSVGNAGDFDHDGYDDVVIGSHRSNYSGAIHSGSVFVVSGRTGRLLQHFHSSQQYAYFGWNVAGCGDLDVDGTPDLLIGAPSDRSGGGVGAAFVISGASGLEIYRFDGVNGLYELGDEVEPLGDWNLDGRPDFAIAAQKASSPGQDRNGAVLVISGRDGSVLHDFRGVRNFSGFGATLAGGGDVNADGIPDLLVGAPQDLDQFSYRSGSLTIYSGADGSILLEKWGVHPNSAMGASMAIMGDVNSDGHADYCLGTAEPVNGHLWTGTVSAYSGRDHSLLWQRFGRGQYDFFGDPLAAAGDFNRDGIPDLLACSPRHTDVRFTFDSSALVLSGEDGRDLAEFHEHLFSEEFARAAVGDLRSVHDPWPAVAVAATWAGWADEGRVGVYRYDPWIRLSVDSVSAASNTLARLDLNFTDQARHSHYRIVLSGSGSGPSSLWGLEIPLTQDGLFVRTLSGDRRMYSGSSGLVGRLDSLGQASAAIGFTAGFLSSAVGRTFHIAAIAFPAPNAPGFSSAAVRLTVLP